MRIIGGHDYFDSAMAHGSDHSLVFKRRRNEDAPVLPFAESGLEPLLRDTLAFDAPARDRWRRESSFASGKAVHEFQPQVVWFAGRRYGGIRVATRSLDRAYFAKPDSDEWFWDHGKFAEFLDSIGARLRKADHFALSHNVTASSLREHFEREPTRAESEWLMDARVSIAVWKPSTSQRYSKYWRQDSGWKIDVDGLGKMGFARKLDPFAAFQELSMWVGGVLPRQGNPMVEITDEKVMVAKHGMDEWSFRTPPGPKR